MRVPAVPVRPGVQLLTDGCPAHLRSNSTGTERQSHGRGCRRRRPRSMRLKHATRAASGFSRGTERCGGDGTPLSPTRPHSPPTSPRTSPPSHSTRLVRRLRHGRENGPAPTRCTARGSVLRRAPIARGRSRAELVHRWGPVPQDTGVTQLYQLETGATETRAIGNWCHKPYRLTAGSPGHRLKTGATRVMLRELVPQPMATQGRRRRHYIFWPSIGSRWASFSSTNLRLRASSVRRTWRSAACGRTLNHQSG